MGQFRDRISKLKHIEDSTERIVRGMSIGVGIGMLPIPGQMLFAGILAKLFRANVTASVISVWISNPLTWIPIFSLNLEVGLQVMGDERYFYEIVGEALKSKADFFRLGPEITLKLIIGSVIMAFFGFVLTYILARPIVKKWHTMSVSEDDSDFPSSPDSTDSGSDSGPTDSLDPEPAAGDTENSSNESNQRPVPETGEAAREPSNLSSSAIQPAAETTPPESEKSSNDSRQRFISRNRSPVTIPDIS